MTINELESKLTQNLKSFLRSEGHVKTGKLLSQIHVNASYNGQFKLSVSGLDYMEFLDDGEFLQNFFNLDSTLDLLAEYLATVIEEGIGDK